MLREEGKDEEEEEMSRLPEEKVIRKKRLLRLKLDGCINSFTYHKSNKYIKIA